MPSSRAQAGEERVAEVNRKSEEKTYTQLDEVADVTEQLQTHSNAERTIKRLKVVTEQVSLM